MAKGKKTGGREQGTPNKVTKELRNIINDFLNEKIEQVQKDFEILEPKDRVKIYIELLQYSLPKYQSIDSTFNLSIEERAKQINSLFPTEEELKQIIDERNN